MKNIVLSFLFLFLATVAFPQKSMTFGEAEKAGIFKSLDQMYTGGVDSDSTKSLFKDQQEYTRAYQSFITDFAHFLAQENFKWGKQVRCFNKIYFSKDGRVDYFLYHFKQGDITELQEKKFAQLLADFIKKAKFSLSAPTRFAQCSPVKYEDI